MGSTLKKLKTTQAVHRIFGGDEELLDFFFHHKNNHLRNTPEETIVLAQDFSYNDLTIIKLALELMGYKCHLSLEDLLNLDNEFFIRVINGLLYYKEIQIELDEEILC